MADGSASTTDRIVDVGLDVESRAGAVPLTAVPKVGALARSFISCWRTSWSPK